MITHERTALFTTSDKRETPTISPQDSTTWNWGTIPSGDCTMSTASLTLNNDGSGFFQATFSSPDQGDVWEVQGLALIDDHGIVLYTIPQFDSPPTVGPGTTDGLRNYVYFPAYMYSYISSITMYHHC